MNPYIQRRGMTKSNMKTRALISKYGKKEHAKSNLKT